MLKVYFGDDSLSSRQKLAKALDKEEGSVVRFDEVSITEEVFRDTLGSQGLFGGRTAVVLDYVLEKADAAEYILSSIKNLAESTNAFFLVTGPLDVKTIKQFEKGGAGMERSDKNSLKQRDMPGSFALADAFARRDKKTAWMLFTKLQLDETSPQELCGTLAWQMRLVVLAHSTNSAIEAGVSEYPYKKAKSCVKYFTQIEAEIILRKLIGIYHFDPAMNRGNTAGALERLILSL